MTHPDTSGMLRFLTDELQDAEDKGDRGTTSNPLPRFSLLTTSRRLVWIVGHVLTGWDGTNPLRNPTNLCSSAFMPCICALLTYPSHSSLSDVCLTFLLDLKIFSHLVSRSVDRFSPHVIASTSASAHNHSRCQRADSFIDRHLLWTVRIFPENYP